jgi:hypothetical protein
MSITADSTIVAVVVSAIISVSILLVSSYIIQPKRIRKSWYVEHLGKRLEVYGALITMLDSMKAKANGHPLAVQKIMEENPYIMENPFDYERLLKIMQNKNYLLSKEISQLWFKRLKDDKYNVLSSSSSKTDRPLFVDFREIHERAKKEYSELKAEYEVLTSIKLAN